MVFPDATTLLSNINPENRKDVNPLLQPPVPDTILPRVPANLRPTDGRTPTTSPGRGKMELPTKIYKLVHKMICIMQ